LRQQNSGADRGARYRRLQRFTKGGTGFFGRLSAADNENIALLGYVLHFSYSEILMMDIVDFSEFVSIALKILKAQNGTLKA